MSKTDNKELEEAIKRALITKHRGTTLISVEILETVLKELGRLQEENKTMKTEIAEHVYWESTPSAEIKNLYIAKDKIKEKIEGLKKKEKNMFLRIRKLENTIGMSLEEYEELNKLYSEYNEILIKIESLEELLEGK